MDNKEKDYARLIAAQNESARRLKIKGINNTKNIRKRTALQLHLVYVLQD